MGRIHLLAVLPLLPVTLLRAAPQPVEHHASEATDAYQIVLLRGTVYDGAKTLRIANSRPGVKPELTERHLWGPLHGGRKGHHGARPRTFPPHFRP